MMAILKKGFKRLFIILISQLILTFALTGQTAAQDACSTLVQILLRESRPSLLKFFSPSAKAPSSEILIARGILQKWNVPSGSSLQGPLSHEEFYLLFSQIPKEFQEVFEHIPPSKNDALKYLQTFRKLFTLEGHFLSDFEFFMRKKVMNDISTIHYITEAKRRFEVLTSTQKSQLIKKWFDRFETIRINHYWKNNFFQFLTIKQEGRKQFLFLGKNKYPIKKKGKNLIAKVGKDKIRHPKFNPLVPENSERVLRNYFQKAPDHYDVEIGLDGNFYLMDGNHRFAYLEQKEEVWIVLPKNGQTLSFRHYLDFIGVSQPSHQMLQRIWETQGRSLIELLSPAQQENLLWNTVQLQMPIGRTATINPFTKLL